MVNPQIQELYQLALSRSTRKQYEMQIQYDLHIYPLLKLIAQENGLFKVKVKFEDRPIGYSNGILYLPSEDYRQFLLIKEYELFNQNNEWILSWDIPESENDS